MPRPQGTLHCSRFPTGSALLPAELDIMSLLKRAKTALLLAVELANAQGRVAPSELLPTIEILLCFYP